MASSRTALLLTLLVVIVAGSAAVSAYIVYGRGSSTTSSLPPQCTRPQGGYLIVASANGYNDSIDHGVPANSWPVVQVHNGTTVSITVCNTDSQAHGFQIAHFFDASIETVAPGKALTVTFVADRTGAFRIYCSIFCTIHGFMQSGELVIS